MRYRTYPIDSPLQQQGVRPYEIKRPCSCGCDRRGNPTLKGYIIWSDGVTGSTLEAHTEAEYKRLRAAMHSTDPAYEITLLLQDPLTERAEWFADGMRQLAQSA